MSNPFRIINERLPRKFSLIDPNETPVSRASFEYRFHILQRMDIEYGCVKFGREETENPYYKFSLGHVDYVIEALGLAQMVNSSLVVEFLIREKFLNVRPDKDYSERYSRSPKRAKL